MTATPIPRTLAMTVYGDLDVSVIDELPPGRKPIQTVHYRQMDREKLYQGMRYQLELGRQVYVVYPLIKENESLDLRDLQTGYNQWSLMILAILRSNGIPLCAVPSKSPGPLNFISSSAITKPSVLSTITCIRRRECSAR